MNTKCDCPCGEEKEQVTIPVRSFTLPAFGMGINVDADSIPSGVEPGPDDTHLVTRDGQLVWEPIGSSPSWVAPDTLYVNAAAGDDDNDGLTAATAFKTIQAAISRFEGYTFLRKNCVIHVAAGTYAEDVSIAHLHGVNYLRFKGDSSDYPLIVGEVRVNNHVFARFDYFHFKGHTYGIWADFCSWVDLSNCRITSSGSTQGCCLLAAQGSRINFFEHIDIDCTAGCKAALQSVEGAIRLNYGTKLTINGKVEYAVCLIIWGGGLVAEGDVTVTGTVTGSKYWVTGNSFITVPGGSTSFFPGSLPGSLTSGGVYFGY